MSNLVPELHDVLKLTILDHDVYRWSEQDHNTFKDFLPTGSETWKGITQHHLSSEFEMYPSEPDTFYLRVADNLASNVTRIGKSGPLEYRLNKLWKGEGEMKDIRLRETQDIIQLFRFLQRDPSWEEFLGKYESLLRNRPEDFRKGLNTTSLYTHCKVTGQFYRILRNSSLFPLSADMQGKTKEEVTKLYGDKYNKEWQLIVARCKFHFLQKPFRVRDLNIFGALHDLMAQISVAYPDNILLATSDELLLVIPDDTLLSDIVSRAQQNGFWVRLVKARRCLNELKPNPESMQPRGPENLYQLPDMISPPLCEICQSAKATRVWPEDYVLSHIKLCSNCRQLLSGSSLSSISNLICEADKPKLEDVLKEPATEELCQRCFDLRAQGTRLCKLERWSNQMQTKVAWVKLSLDFDQLEKVLTSLSGAEISFSVVAEFQEDYSNFLYSFKNRVQSDFGTANMENITDDFFCLNVGGFKETFKVLKIYHQLMQQLFPAFLNLENSPLKIGVVCSSVKFPFFQVWRILGEARTDIFVSIQGARTMRAPISALELLVRAAGGKYRKSALHKLTKIEETSQTLAELTFQNRRDEESGTYSVLARSLRPKLDFSSIFAFVRLIEG